MNDYIIEFTDTLSKEEEEKMRKSFEEHESSHGIDVNYKPFVIMAKDCHGTMIGAITAFTAFAEIYIDDMWIDEPMRRQGLGRKLLHQLEEHFTGKGFNNMNLVTSAFQAPEFYKKCGFTVEFIRINTKNPQLTKTFFVKYFDDEVQTQGILNH